MENDGILTDITAYRDWALIKRINKGWSEDKKFYIEGRNGEKLLLRISGSASEDRKKREFETMKRAVRLGVKMSVPIEFGACGHGEYVYSLLSWIEGTTLDELIQNASVEDQYGLGVEAGIILKKFHSIPAPPEQPDWEQRMKKKISHQIERYKTCGVKVTNDEYALRYIEDNLSLLKGRPQTYQHGDYHVGNLVIGPDKKIAVIDFNRWDFGDPYEEFYKMMMFSRELSTPFAVGQVNGYFDNLLPDDFFDILALYLAHVILYSVVWAMPFGSDEVNGMIKRAEMVLSDLDNFRTTAPKWYKCKKEGL